jgi:phosphopantothenoylcysteine decarboxylase/phosphopantothenate--cysteine ligase
VADVVIAAAAVADFRPAEAAAGKLRKADAPEQVALERTTDILGSLGESKGGRVLVGFAAEAGDAVGNARAKLSAKNLDLVVANDITDPDAGFEVRTNRVTFLSGDREEALPCMDKSAVARELLDRVEAILKGGKR